MFWGPEVGALLAFLRSSRSSATGLFLGFLWAGASSLLAAARLVFVVVVVVVCSLVVVVVVVEVVVGLFELLWCCATATPTTTPTRRLLVTIRLLLRNFIWPPETNEGFRRLTFASFLSPVVLICSRLALFVSLFLSSLSLSSFLPPTAISSLQVTNLSCPGLQSTDLIEFTPHQRDYFLSLS